MKICLYFPENSTQPVSETLLYAQRELNSYLSRMGRPDLTITLGVADLQKEGMPAVEDTALDDQYLIDIKGPEGRILGGNERSVLLGVYDYLRRLGCSFLRPGKQFEVVPVKMENEEFYVQARCTASLRHRGVCIEGSDSIDNILDFLDWLPKLGYNSFFPQFETPQTFLERFYNVDYNPYRPRLNWTMKQSWRVMEAMDEAMQLRGILQHRVGHGWTAKTLGCTATGWDTEEKEFTEQERNMIALVNGKRELWGGIPTNTSLCMTNPDAIRKFSDLVVEYAKENPSTDYLHLWLADDSNNHCECENCRKKRPADHYIHLLNCVDERLQEEGLDVKLVMLLYVDLLWAPQTERLKHPERFALMFAPITRTFEKAFDQIEVAEHEPEFVLNHLEFPGDLGMNLRFLKDWQKAAEGVDCFDYDYYMGRTVYGDPTQINLAKILIRDFKTHKALGINGISSCQNLRCQMPNGFSGYAMGQIAMDTTKTYEALSKKYYTDAYGEEGVKVLEILEKLSLCFKQDYIRYPKPGIDEEYFEMLQDVPELTGALEELYENHTPCIYEAQEKLWAELKAMAEYTRIYAASLRAKVMGDVETASRIFEEELRPMVNRYDMIDQGANDIFRINWVLGRVIKEGV